MTRAADQELVDSWDAIRPGETTEERSWRVDNPPDDVCAAWMRLDIAQTQGIESEEDEEMVGVEDEECESDPDDEAMGGDLYYDALYDIFDYTNCYETEFEEEDLIDIHTIVSSIVESGQRRRKPKFKHKRVLWEDYKDMLVSTNNFHDRLRMPVHHFVYLLSSIKDCISVDVRRSLASTEGVPPISPEIVLCCGLCFVGLDAPQSMISDCFGISLPSVRRVINMFLCAIDYNTTCPELQIELPDPACHNELNNLAFEWSRISTAQRVLDGFCGAVDGWLATTEAPFDAPHPADYYSGHYQCFGINVQAMCDPHLVFMYAGVTAPGKVNDSRAFLRCTELLEWLNSLPDEFFIGADNAYELSRRIMIPFSGAERNVVDFRTFNFYLSQLRVRIEMAFGRLVTKWRILKRALNYSTQKNIQIIRVCMKLHNFNIRMQQQDNHEAYNMGVLQAANGTNKRYIRPYELRGKKYPLGYLPVTPNNNDNDGDNNGDNGENGGENDGANVGENEGDDGDGDGDDITIDVATPTKYPSLLPDASRREYIVEKMQGLGLQRPEKNKRRNRKSD